jgi:hypothetical protein
VIALNANKVPRGQPRWGDPRTGARRTATGVGSGLVVRFEPPGEGDWLLLVTAPRR